MGYSLPMEVKICGLRSREALEAALEGGASFAGFIFFERSPRNIRETDAAPLSEIARSAGARSVAVTVDSKDDALGRIVETVRPDLLQLHGSESPARVAQIKRRFGLPVIKAIAVHEADDLSKIAPYRGVADRFLLDAKPPKGSQLPGGNAVAFDWSLLQGFDEPGYILAGGIRADNVASAIRIAHPAGLDVSSGVESSPGVKDPKMIRDFFRSFHRALG